MVCTRIDSEDGAIIHIRTRLARLFCEKNVIFLREGGHESKKKAVSGGVDVEIRGERVDLTCKGAGCLVNCVA